MNTRNSGDLRISFLPRSEASAFENTIPMINEEIRASKLVNWRIGRKRNQGEKEVVDVVSRVGRKETLLRQRLTDLSHFKLRNEHDVAYSFRSKSSLYRHSSYLKAVAIHVVPRRTSSPATLVGSNDHVYSAFWWCYQPSIDSSGLFVTSG
jgi:hypothetical protein